MNNYYDILIHDLKLLIRQYLMIMIKIPNLKEVSKH